MSGVSGLRKHGHTADGDGGTIVVPGGDAVDVTYDNSGSGLAATDVQGAIDELDTTLDAVGDPVDIADDAANVQGVNFEDQGANPSTPASGHTIAYTKSDGLYVKDDAGAVTGPLSASGASFATPAVALGSSAAAGAASTVIRSDSTIAAFDATVPVTQAYSDAAATGSAAFAARRDHKHGMPASGGVAEITDLPTAEIDTSLVLAPDGAGGVEFRAETGGGVLATAHGARVHRASTSFSVGNNALTAVEFDAEDFDTDTMHDSSANKTKIVIPTISGVTTGLWAIKASGYTDASSGSIDCQIRVNGSPIAFDRFPFNATGFSGFHLSADFVLSATDYVECFVRTTGGSFSAIHDAGNSPHFSVVFLGKVT